eukprot:Clim_evm9s12 gene=Clim_evmTU9s12
MNVLRASLRQARPLLASSSMSQRQLMRPASSVGQISTIGAVFATRRFYSNGVNAAVDAESEPEDLRKENLENLSGLREIKDANVIFDYVWGRLEKEFGQEKMNFPREIIWLNGAPGAGKGANTGFLLKARGIASEAIVMSDLLKNADFQKFIDRGDMIGDADVVELLFRTLLREEYQKGALVDGFPRTKVQVRCLHLLNERMLQLRSNYFGTALRELFPRPQQRVVVLYVTEKESLERQLKRGVQIKEHNKRVRDSGHGQLKEERATDYDERLIRKRYQIFKDHYDTLLEMRKHFPFYLINAQGSLETVQRSIQQQFEYQSSMELSEETFDALQVVPLASQISRNAKADLVGRLDGYQQNTPTKFRSAVRLIESDFVPKLRKHCFAGICLVRSDNPAFEDEGFVDMVIDVLTDRGFQVSFDPRVRERPTKVDLQTGRIMTEAFSMYTFTVRFPPTILRTHLTDEHEHAASHQNPQSPQGTEKLAPN